MSLAGGLSAQFGCGAETTFNTPVTVSRFLEFNNENIKQTIERIESSGLRPSRRVVREKQVNEGRKAFAGDVEFDVGTNGFALLFTHSLGENTKTQPNAGSAPNVYEYLCKVGALDAKSLTVQVARADTGGTIRAFTYGGCKVPKWELLCDEKGFLKFKLGIAGASETTAEALASASYTAESVPLTYVGATFKMAGTEIPVKKFSLVGNNSLSTARYAMKATGSQTPRVQLEGTGIRDYTGKIDMEFESLVQYERFVNKTFGELVAVFEGPTLEAGIKAKVEVKLPSVRYDGETPTVPGPQLLDQMLNFKVMDSAAGNGPVQIAYVTKDSAE